jgi:hypothetical protein
MYTHASKMIKQKKEKKYPLNKWGNHGLPWAVSL